MTVTRSQYSVYDGLTACRLVSTSNVSGTYVNGQLNNGVGATLTVAASSLTIDSVATALSDRILLVGQTAANQNGIYVVTSISSTVVLTRSQDFQCIEQIKSGQFLTIQAGTLNSGAIYTLIDPIPSVFGVSDLSFVSASAAGSGLYLEIANNLSDVASFSTSLTNLKIKRGTTASYSGGAASNNFVATGVLVTDIVVVTMLSSTNAVGIVKALPSTNQIAVTWTADPGANSVANWIAIGTV